jgi:hypothetical protein|mmetsp:Transcript_3579/g.3942  ORF Transcript_3579/g.3942 Transcript_3579/m.3942 type:complete len:108 (+) Transcript_3579:115-438(+)|eukprot:gene6309-6789_t
MDSFSLSSSSTSDFKSADNDDNMVLIPAFYCRSISASCDSNMNTPTSLNRPPLAQRIRSSSPTDNYFNFRDSPRDILKKKLKSQSAFNTGSNTPVPDILFPSVQEEN